ncbi:DNA helicase [Tanacetum coccineum]
MRSVCFTMLSSVFDVLCLRLSLADIVHNPRLTDPDIASSSFDRETVSTGFLNPYTYLCLRCICGGMDLMIGLTLWNEMATNFDIRAYEQMEKPVMIAVASCCVTRYNGLQLSWTSATHYYLNPNIPETYQIREMYVLHFYIEYTHYDDIYTLMSMVVTSGVDVWRGYGGVVVDGMRRLSRDSGGDGGGVVAVVDPSDEREEYTMMMMGVSLKFLAGAGGGAGFRWWPPET